MMCRGGMMPRSRNAASNTATISDTVTVSDARLCALITATPLKQYAGVPAGTCVAADVAQHFRINAGVAFEPPVELVSEAVVPVEFIDEFEDDAGAETVTLLDVTLAAEATRRLIPAILKDRIGAVSQTEMFYPAGGAGGVLRPFHFQHDLGGLIEA